MTVQYTRYSMPTTTTVASPYVPLISTQRKTLRVDVPRPHQFMMAPALSRELPMPNVSRISNLNQAHATLLHCCNKLTKSSRDSAASSPSSTGSTGSPGSEDRLDLWLERWERAFTDYLSLSMPSMGANELTECRVLKANHLASTIIASSKGPENFESEFQAIIDLAGAVLRTRAESNTSSPQITSRPQPPHGRREPQAVSSGLDVRDPVILVATRCTGRSIRKRANEILSRYYQ